LSICLPAISCRESAEFQMHEIGIVEAILDAVKTEARLRPGSVPRKVAVRIGELAAVDPEALRFSFEALTRATELEALELEIEMGPRRHLCSHCNLQYHVVEFDLHCPQCGQESTRCVGGEELEIAYLEMETYEPSTA
jgi:hydrogenase nickel incorporation protein HypA/HybF